VIELLTLSPVVPRSIRYAVARVDTALDHVAEEALAYSGSEASRDGRGSEARREIGRLHGELAYQRLEDVLRVGVHDWLRDLQRRCYLVGDCMEQEFFAHRPLTAEEVLV
jgi:uncharacterized alpha-E superfamily protein